MDVWQHEHGVSNHLLVKVYLKKIQRCNVMVKINNEVLSVGISYGL